MTRRFFILLVSLVTVLVLAMPGFAQQVTIEFTQPVNVTGNTDGGVYVGLYQGTLNGVTTDFVCDDFLHDITYNQSWTANAGVTNPVSSTAEFSWSNVTNQDLIGWVTGSGTGDYGLSSLSKQQLYGMVTYLAEQIFADPTNLKGQWGNLSFAIWSITDSAWAACEPNCSSSNKATWGQFSNAYNSTVQSDIYKALQEVLSDGFNGSLNVYTPFPDVASGQEFLSTPEPAAIVLLGWGTLALALAPLVSRLRRKKVQA